MTAATTDTVMLFRPRIRYTSTGESQVDAMMTWRADLELGYLDEYGNEWNSPPVVGGHAEFVIINIGQHPIADLLDSLPHNTAHFADLFEDEDVAPAVQDQFPDAPFNRVLIVRLVEIAEPLRGNALGAWLVTELVERIASPTDTLVLLHPNPEGPEPTKTAERAAARSLTRYGKQFGLTPIKHHPEFLGAATAYGHLSRARDVLRALENTVFPVPRSVIGIESPAEPRHTVVSEPAPAGLRLVRN
ncbi:hypothetical protein B5P44_00650 [Mycobacterium sp. CBMA 213]|uniref:Uncharacterized protein n=1 Tax=Mycolicibacterium sp. CBMA 213 TaxID=1968788 RepID=A0A343VRB4_9MYCO|nr:MULTISPECIES: hypothetical protein [unclassified Mycolicibacterium]AVN58438.1 hypothetical protein B5P44_p00143 [Mycolicibacterium sp. CBMA 213]MUL61095.1 hypothetical protein [Mycolicibacterium sp. CBMA 335]MUM03332.1 hypothetical protein [Mycolicibacterium sp. CBMA 213]